MSKSDVTVCSPSFSSQNSNVNFGTAVGLVTTACCALSTKEYFLFQYICKISLRDFYEN